MEASQDTKDQSTQTDHVTEESSQRKRVIIFILSISVIAFVVVVAIVKSTNKRNTISTGSLLDSKLCQQEESAFEGSLQRKPLSFCDKNICWQQLGHDIDGQGIEEAYQTDEFGDHVSLSDDGSRFAAVCPIFLHPHKQGYIRVYDICQKTMPCPFPK